MIIIVWRLIKLFNKKFLILALLLMGVVAVSGCTSQNNTTTSPNTVNIQNMAFNPSSLTVPVGTTVKWVNMDSTTHTVTSDTGVFNSGNLNNGQSFSYTFSQAGTFPYHCSIHTNMHGTITVSSAATSTSGSSGSSSSGSGSY